MSPVRTRSPAQSKKPQQNVGVFLCEKTPKTSLVALWDNFKGLENIPEFIDKICDICKPKSVPVLLNNRWELLKATKADGVHFDEIPSKYKTIKKSISEKSLVGLTCNKDLEIIEWAINNQLDYISFCPIFPSSTSISCELVDFKVIQKQVR